jgi:hypothetical protein
MISLHAITGIQPRSGRTMQVLVIVNGAHLSALLDSGSTHNFVDSAAAVHTGIQLTAQHGLHVAVANSDQVHSLSCCKGLQMVISGKPFSIDCYSLDLRSYDMVLGVQWLKSLGPILWDFGQRTLAFVQNRHHVLWMMTSTSP